MITNADISESPKLQRIKEKLDLMDCEELPDIDRLVILKLYARLNKDNRRKISEFAENLNSGERGSGSNGSN